MSTKRTVPPSIPFETEQPWSNWAGNQSCTAQLRAKPRDESEVVDIVRYAISNDLTVRVAGSGHSFTPVVPTDGLLVDLGHLNGVTATDPQRCRVSALGGTTIGDFGAPLWDAGLSLTNQGDIDKQTITGAIATGTHGSGIRLGSFSAATRRIRLINGHGEVVEITEDDPRTLHAAQVAVGTLGVILEVELDVSPRYHLREEISYRPWQEIVEYWDELIANHRHFSFFWCPHDRSAQLYELPAPPDQPMTDHCYVKVYDETDIAEPDGIVTDEGARVDRAYRIYPGGFGSPFHEMEYMVPAECGKEAVGAIRELMRTEHPDQMYPIEVRWTAADEAYLSPNHHRDTTVISVSGEPGTDYWPFLRDVDLRLREFDARPHWGKIHLMTRDRLPGLFEEFYSFLAVRRDFDPHGTFLNDHLHPLLG